MAEKASNKAQNFLAFIGVAVTALILCISAIIFHCIKAPHPSCDAFFYRVLPLFDCVYIMGAIIGLIAAKMNYPLLYVFFIVSACCTCSCYSLNSVYDLMVLTGNMDPLFASKGTEKDLLGQTTNCSKYEHQYHYQKVDLGLETFGIILHMIAIFFALKSRKRLVRVEMRKARNMNQNCRRV